MSETPYIYGRVGEMELTVQGNPSESAEDLGEIWDEKMDRMVEEAQKFEDGTDDIGVE